MNTQSRQFSSTIVTSPPGGSAYLRADLGAESVWLLPGGCVGPGCWVGPGRGWIILETLDRVKRGLEGRPDEARKEKLRTRLLETSSYSPDDVTRVSFLTSSSPAPSGCPSRKDIVNTLGSYTQTPTTVTSSTNVTSPIQTDPSPSSRY